MSTIRDEVTSKRCFHVSILWIPQMSVLRETDDQDSYCRCGGWKCLGVWRRRTASKIKRKVSFIGLQRFSVWKNMALTLYAKNISRLSRIVREP